MSQGLSRHVVLAHRDMSPQRRMADVSALLTSAVYLLSRCRDATCAAGNRRLVILHPQV